VAWQLTEAVNGLAEACRALDVPIVSGNVSLYNETGGRAIPPTPTVGMVGLLEDVSLAVPTGFVADSTVVILGREPETLGASEYAGDGAFPRFDLDDERRLDQLLRRLAARRLLRSAQDVSDGGLAVALAECALVGGVGATLDVVDVSNVALFSEDQGRAVITCASDSVGAVLQQARDGNVPAQVAGRTGGDQLRIRGKGGVAAEIAGTSGGHSLPVGDGLSVSLTALRAAWEATA
jgi:phosphoribosylformylglycinamidine synthase